MALDNIRQRLELAFPGRSAVEVEDDGATYAVRLRFPRVGEEPRDGWTGTAEPAATAS
jgi:hypothetical protein